MNNLIHNITSMTSVEIAKVTGKHHRHTLRDIEVIVTALQQYGQEKDGPNLGSGLKSSGYLSEKDYSNLSAGFTESTYLASNGKHERCYILDREATFCLITGYSPVLRMKVIQRWQELENQPTPPIQEIDWEAMTELLEVVSKLAGILSKTVKKAPPVPKLVPGSNTASADSLLKGSSLSARAFLILAHRAGLVERTQTYTAKGKLRKFCKLTETGLNYGINKVNSFMSEELQILWFTDKFDEVLQLAMQHMPK